MKSFVPLVVPSRSGLIFSQANVSIRSAVAPSYMVSTEECYSLSPMLLEVEGSNVPELAVEGIDIPNLVLLGADSSGQ